MDVIFKWILVVICSFVGSMFLITLIPNNVMFSFCLALILAFIWTKGDGK